MPAAPIISSTGWDRSPECRRSDHRGARLHLHPSDLGRLLGCGRRRHRSRRGGQERRGRGRRDGWRALPPTRHVVALNPAHDFDHRPEECLTDRLDQDLDAIDEADNRLQALAGLRGKLGLVPDIDEPRSEDRRVGLEPELAVGRVPRASNRSPAYNPRRRAKAAAGCRPASTSCRKRRP